MLGSSLDHYVDDVDGIRDSRARPHVANQGLRATLEK